MWGMKPQKNAVLVFGNQIPSLAWHSPRTYLLRMKAREKISGIIKWVSNIGNIICSYLKLLIIILCIYYYCVYIFTQY